MVSALGKSANQGAFSPPEAKIASPFFIGAVLAVVGFVSTPGRLRAGPPAWASCLSVRRAKQFAQALGAARVLAQEGVVFV